MARLVNFPIFNNRTIITLDQFLTNPTGKGSSMMARRDKIKDDLSNRYYKMLKENGGKLNYRVYIDDNEYIFYFKIPSETFKDLYYDVVLEFVCHEKKFSKFSTINDYSINFFSNSPHMTFTYTYVLNENGLLVSFLRNIKYSKYALTHRPKVTNPIEIFGFEKSCYYACMYIDQLKLWNKSTIEKNATKITRSTRMDLINVIKSQEQKSAEYDMLKKKEADKKRKERNTKVNTSNAKHLEAINKSKAKKTTKSSFKSVVSKPGFKPLIQKKK